MTARPEHAQRGAYWDDRYERIGPQRVSWHQAHPSMSLRLVDTLRPSPSAAVIDVGGGASTLVDGLVDRRFSDVTVLDVSDVALDTARRRLNDPDGVSWLRADVLTWEPQRRWHLWHDRAVFHFLTTADDRAAYLRRFRESLLPGGAFIIGTFAADGPDQCSGLPVERYDAAKLIDTIRADVGQVEVVAQHREEHITPDGATQPFEWVAGTIGRPEL